MTVVCNMKVQSLARSSLPNSSSPLRRVVAEFILGLVKSRAITSTVASAGIVIPNDHPPDVTTELPVVTVPFEEKSRTSLIPQGRTTP